MIDNKTVVGDGGKNMNECSPEMDSRTESHITGVAYVDDVITFMTAELAAEFANLAANLLDEVVRIFENHHPKI